MNRKTQIDPTTAISPTLQAAMLEEHFSLLREAKYARGAYAAAKKIYDLVEDRARSIVMSRAELKDRSRLPELAGKVKARASRDANELTYARRDLARAREALEKAKAAYYTLDKPDPYAGETRAMMRELVREAIRGKKPDAAEVVAYETVRRFVVDAVGRGDKAAVAAVLTAPVHLIGVDTENLGAIRDRVVEMSAPPELRVEEEALGALETQIERALAGYARHVGELITEAERVQPTADRAAAERAAGDATLAKVG